MPAVHIERHTAINTEALDAALRRDLGAVVNGISRQPGLVIVHLHRGATAVHMEQARQIVTAHDPNRLTPRQQAALRRRYQLDNLRADGDLAVLRDKSAAELRAEIVQRIDAWTTLAEAQADLRNWLPLLLIGLAASQDVE